MNPISVISKVFQYFSDEAISYGTDLTKDKIKDILRKRELSELLDRYDQVFLESHDTSTSIENIDMVSVLNKRRDVIRIAEKYLEQPFIDIKVNRRNQFIDESSQLLGVQSDTLNSYLTGFYDLIYMKETKEFPAEERALFNSLADQICDEITGIKSRVGKLESKVGSYNNSTDYITDFGPYYALVEKRFTRKKPKEDAELVGDYSDEEAYIEAQIDIGSNVVPVLSYLEEWFCEDDFGTLLIYGEPGHGKTSLCNKAMVDYYRGNFLRDKAKNVLAVSLNTGENPRIIKDGMVKIEEALAWGDNRQHVFTFKDCAGALLFMDGFDEFIDDAKSTNIKDIVTFMKTINGLADENNIHIVVLSRTIAVNNFLSDSTIKNKNFKLLPITGQQQDTWLDDHNEYGDYREAFDKIRNDNDMENLLGIPFLFRLIVHSRFDKVSSNIVQLYDSLLIHLMDKRNIRGDDFESVKSGLRNLAYDIYCTDTDTAVLPKDKKDERWLIAFFIKQTGKERTGFFHRSFYQYFLADFIYCGLLNLKNDDAEAFIGYFAERELDGTVRKYLSLMKNEETEILLFRKLYIAICALVRSEAYLNLKPRYSYGTVDTRKLERTINIYHNMLHICSAFSYVIQIPFKDKLDSFLRVYPSSSIVICSDINKSADLSGANLSGAYLKESSLIRADLSEANLEEANLIRAELHGANMGKTNLSGADLKGADLIGSTLTDANLNGANLTGANLNKANLIGTDLRGANLKGANLSGANLNGANLNGAILSEADFFKANLKGAHLNRAILRKTNLKGADLSGADLSNADLEGVIRD